MPLCFDIKCRNCGEEDFVVSDYRSVRVDDQDIILPHPGESDAIKQYGLTEDQAALNGQLFHNEGYACRDYGEVIFLKRPILPGGIVLCSTKTKVMFVIILFLACVFLVFTDTNIFCLLLLLASALIACVFINDRRVRQKVKKHHDIHYKQQCYHCQSENIIQIGAYLLSNNVLLRCTACGEKQASCKPDGVSLSRDKRRA